MHWDYSCFEIKAIINIRMNTKMVKIAIMGMGVVGGGVADIILNNASTLVKKSGAEIEIKYVLDKRSFEGHPL